MLNQKNSAVFFSAGLGDAILLIPLLKELRENNHRVTGVFTSPHRCEELFNDSGLLDKTIILRGNTIIQILSAFRLSGCFSTVYMNAFASTRKNLILAHILGKKIITNRVPETLHGIFRKKIQFISPLIGIHDAVQNLRLFKTNAANTDLNEEVLSLNTRGTGKLMPTTIAVQVSSGNSPSSYKNWPAENWIQLLKKAASEFPTLRFLLLGDENETSLISRFLSENIPGVESRIGKTSVSEALEIIRECVAFTGTDGGLFHIAAACKKPTFTIWGPSDFNLYGYAMINSAKNHFIFNNVDCRPCNSWIAPNTSRVSRPEDCPDKKCMLELGTGSVYSAFREFIIKNIPHAG